VVEERDRPEGPAGEMPPVNEHGHDIYTIANIITVLRLILVPLFFTVLINGKNNELAFILFAVAASTDWLDGQIARRTGTVTALGKAIDPLVDRLLIASGVIGLYVVDRLPLWIPLVLVARDLALGYGVWRLETIYHQRMSVTIVGKWTTALLLIGFADLILAWPMVPGLGLIDSAALPGFGSEPAVLGIWFVYVGVVLSIASAVGYAITFGKTVSTTRS
jgi:cardiolipin synthase (CMP-forming)